MFIVRRSGETCCSARFELAEAPREVIGPEVIYALSMSSVFSIHLSNRSCYGTFELRPVKLRLTGQVAKHPVSNSPDVQQAGCATW